MCWLSDVIIISNDFLSWLTYSWPQAREDTKSVCTQGHEWTAWPFEFLRGCHTWSFLLGPCPNKHVTVENYSTKWKILWLAMIPKHSKAILQDLRKTLQDILCRLLNGKWTVLSQQSAGMQGNLIHCATCSSRMITNPKNTNITKGEKNI